MEATILFLSKQSIDFVNVDIVFMIQIYKATYTNSYIFTKSNHLNAELLWYSNGRLVSSCQMVPYSNDGLKTQLKKTVMVQNVQYSNGSPNH